MPALVALVLVTAVWGVTFVQVKDAVALYPLFAFLAVRFLIATGVLVVPGWRRLRGLGVKGGRRRRSWARSSRPATRSRPPASRARLSRAPVS